MAKDRTKVETEEALRAEALALECDPYDLEAEADASACDEDAEVGEHVEAGLNLGLALAEMRALPEYAGADLKVFRLRPDKDSPWHYFFVARDEDDLCERIRGI